MLLMIFQISGIKGAKAAFSFTAATMTPCRFILSLMEKVLSTGQVNLQTHTSATCMTKDESSGDYIITTPRGSTRAKKVIHANNTYVSHLLPKYRKNIIPCKCLCCRITVPEGKVAPLVTNSFINRTADNTLSCLIP